MGAHTLSSDKVPLEFYTKPSARPAMHVEDVISLASRCPLSIVPPSTTKGLQGLAWLLGNMLLGNQGGVAVVEKAQNLCM